MKLTRAAILVSRGMKVLQATPAAYLYRSAAETEGSMTVDDLLALYRPPYSAPPMLALAGLDGVDWSAVSDAYGPATDIPALLRALVSDDPDHREFACLLLHQTIWHQGNVIGVGRAEKGAPSLRTGSTSGEWQRSMVGYSGTGNRKGQLTRKATPTPPRHSSTLLFLLFFFCCVWARPPKRSGARSGRGGWVTCHVVEQSGPPLGRRRGDSIWDEDYHLTNS